MNSDASSTQRPDHNLPGSAAIVKAQMRSWDGFIALGFGSGLSPRAPGTAGTLAAIPLVLAGQWLGSWLFAAALVSGFVLGVWICQRVGQRIGVSDHGALVWDEFIGFGVAMWLAPHGWIWLVVGFLLFRGFDIFKPWPISWADRHIKGGLGVMLDDVLAGLATLVVLLLLEQWLG